MLTRKGEKIKSNKQVQLKISNFASGMNSEIDESILPYKYAKMAYNYSVKKGVLESGLGVKQLSLPVSLFNDRVRDVYMPENLETVSKIYFFPCYYNSLKREKNIMFVYGSDNNLYWSFVEYEGNNLFQVNNSTLSSAPMGITYNLNNEDVMLFSNSEEGLAVFTQTGSFTLSKTAPKIISMCKHYERVFAIEDGRLNKVVFSANLDPTNWNINSDEAGYIDLFDERGKLLKIVSFNDYIYVFREKGITRISAYGDQSEFSVTHMYLTSDKIYGNSVCVCGDRIFFLTKNGLYYFDGNSTYKARLNIESMFKSINNNYCTSAYYDGKLYIACKLDFGDGKKVGAEAYAGGCYNNCLIEYDFKEGDINILRGVDIRDMCVIESGDRTKLALCFYNEHKKKFGELTKDGKIFGIPTQAVWASPMSDLGFPNTRKYISEICLTSKYDCKVKITTDKGEKEYQVKGSLVPTKIKVGIACELLQISFISENGLSNISNPLITIGVD